MAPNPGISPEARRMWDWFMRGPCRRCNPPQVLALYDEAAAELDWQAAIAGQLTIAQLTTPSEATSARPVKE